MRNVAILLVVLGGCSSQRRPENPYVPAKAYHSPASTMAAAGGVVGLAAGTTMLDSDRSKRTRRWGSAAVAGGAALLGFAIMEAIEVEHERERLRRLYGAMLRYQRGSPIPVDPFRPPPPPPPELPFEFVDDSPLTPSRADP